MGFKNTKKTYIGQGEGHSMTPLINRSDKLYVELIDPHSIKINDIIVFLDKSKTLIAHRVVIKRKKIIFTKGDNILMIDDPVPYESVIGKITKIKGKYGTLDFTSLQFKFVNSYLFFFSLITLLLPMSMKRLPFIIFRGRRLLIKLIGY